jgi:hypothetical protein
MRLQLTGFFINNNWLELTEKKTRFMFILLYLKISFTPTSFKTSYYFIHK